MKYSMKNLMSPIITGSTKGPGLLKDIGVNAYRFSLEWGIQPREHVWDEDAIAHYQDIIDILRSDNIEPVVTLHHFTHPLWFIKKYPWHEAASIGKFLTFVEKMTQTLRGVRYWITFNEPYVMVLAGYFEGCTPYIRDDTGSEGVDQYPQGPRETRHSSFRMPHAMVSVAHNMLLSLLEKMEPSR
jgi:hypothetical protein